MRQRLDVKYDVKIIHLVLEWHCTAKRTDRQLNLTSLKTLMSLMNDVISCSSPVMASIPGSIRFKNESRSLRVEDT